MAPGRGGGVGLAGGAPSLSPPAAQSALAKPWRMLRRRRSVGPVPPAASVPRGQQPCPHPPQDQLCQQAEGEPGAPAGLCASLRPPHRRPAAQLLPCTPCRAPPGGHLPEPVGAVLHQRAGRRPGRGQSLAPGPEEPPPTAALGLQGPGSPAEGLVPAAGESRDCWEQMSHRTGRRRGTITWKHGIIYGSCTDKLPAESRSMLTPGWQGLNAGPPRTGMSL
ncbi:uncharacterized protein LOC141989800 [Natator depressus]|uniref:uncharacterized protein LOC141989800 n=1 Tax=Natator depressus TaxID=27790 RepID=UPI003EBA505A